eukprot:353214-Chlamydomonas_euryale.AAC.2
MFKHVHRLLSFTLCVCCRCVRPTSSTCWRACATRTPRAATGSRTSTCRWGSAQAGAGVECNRRGWCGWAQRPGLVWTGTSRGPTNFVLHALWRPLGNPEAQPEVARDPTCGHGRAVSVLALIQRGRAQAWREWLMPRHC